MLGWTQLRWARAEATIKSILDRSFEYTRSCDTDLRKTFARVRRELLQRGLDEKRTDGAPGPGTARKPARPATP